MNQINENSNHGEPKDLSVAEVVYVENVDDYRYVLDVDDVIDALQRIKERYKDPDGTSPSVVIYSDEMPRIGEALSVSVCWLPKADEDDGRYAICINDKMELPHQIGDYRGGQAS